MPLWCWLLLAGVVFLVTYNPHTGNLGKFFGPEIVVGKDAQRETQSNSNPNEHDQ